jgi:hypothetical protein
MYVCVCVCVCVSPLCLLIHQSMSNGYVRVCPLFSVCIACICLNFFNTTYIGGSKGTGKGGGIATYSDTPEVIINKCIFRDNTAGSGMQTSCVCAKGVDVDDVHSGDSFGVFGGDKCSVALPIVFLPVHPHIWNGMVSWMDGGVIGFNDHLYA